MVRKRKPNRYYEYYIEPIDYEKLRAKRNWDLFVSLGGMFFSLILVGAFVKYTLFRTGGEVGIILFAIFTIFFMMFYRQYKCLSDNDI